MASNKGSYVSDSKRFVSDSKRFMYAIPSSAIDNAQVKLTTHFGGSFRGDRSIAEMLLSPSLVEYREVKKNGIKHPNISDSDKMLPVYIESPDSCPAFMRGTRGRQTRNLFVDYHATGRYADLLHTLSGCAIAARRAIEKEKKAQKKAVIKGKLETRLEIELGVDIAHCSLPAVSNRAFYTLALITQSGADPIFQYHGKKSDFLHSTRLSDYVELWEAETNEVVDKDTLEVMMDDFGLDKGEFFTGKGYLLLEDEADIAKWWFDLAAKEKFLPPRPEESIQSHFVTGGTRKRRKNEFRPRDWGQEYLRELKPEDEIKGGVFADGSSYAAFLFSGQGPDRKGVVFLEADHTKNATYVIRLDRFKYLKIMDRKMLRTLKPEGFLGHFPHREEIDQVWIDNVQRCLKTE